MLLNEKEEQNIIRSFEKDMQQSDYPKDKLRAEILGILERDLSEANTQILKSMLQQLNHLVPTNQNEMLRIVI